jgi:hypothetical protein
MQRIRSLFENGAVYEGLRNALALRPPPRELLDLMRTQMPDPASVPAERVRKAARLFTGPSPRALDSEHPIGKMAAAIRAALPEFRDWAPDADEFATQFLATMSGRSAHVYLEPPGFAEGVPGAYLRATRALIYAPAGSTYEIIQANPRPEDFQTALRSAQLSDVLDLVWMVPGTLELKVVQELLDRLCAVVLPQHELRFSPYEEPRYRAALQATTANGPRLAHGGVLNPWSGVAPTAGAAQVRLFLEAFVAAATGEAVPLERVTLA